MAKIFQARPLVSNELTQAKVDIVLPFHGQYQRVHTLCQSIWRHTKSHNYHLYLVDDNSPNKTYALAYKKAPRTTVIQNEKQLGFGGALQHGFESGKNEWVVFIHSDCNIESGNWLQDLLISHLKNPKAGMVSPRTNNPGIDDSRLQASKTDPPSEDIVLDKGYLPLYCALCRRDLFPQIGGFIKAYPYRYYEDEELSYRIKAHGLVEIVSGRSWVYHYGAATVGPLLKTNKISQQMIEENRMKCVADLKSYCQ
jgi:GT2 family glycosyltransferase